MLKKNNAHNFSITSKNPTFWPIFGLIGVLFLLLLKNPRLSHKTSYGLLAPFHYLEKPNDSIQKKSPNRHTSGQMDRPYFINLLTPGGNKNVTHT